MVLLKRAMISLKKAIDQHLLLRGSRSFQQNHFREKLQDYCGLALYYSDLKFFPTISKLPT